MNRPRRSTATKSYVRFVRSNSEDEIHDDKDIEIGDLSSINVDSRHSRETNVEIIRPLTESQIFQTQTSIEESTAQLQIIEAEYAELQKKLSTLDQKRRHISQRINQDQARLGIMQKVPQDILSIIFEFFVLNERQSPWTLMQVDRKWRQTALQTRTMWSGIEISTHSWQKRGHHRSREGREICSTEDQLLRALKRAGTSYLDIKIFANTPDGRYWTNKMLNLFIKVVALLDRLGGSESGGLRIAKLDVSGSIIRSLLFKEITFPHLKEFRIEYPNEALVRCVASSAKKLESLDIHFIYGNTMNPSQAWWSKLQSLKLKGNIGDPGPKRSEIITSILSKATSLKDLELTKFYYNDPPELQLPRLLTFVTDARIGAAQISAPLLTHLKLVQATQYQAEPDAFFDQTFPSLVNLEVEYINRRLQHLRAPALHTLIIRAAPRLTRRYPNNEVWFSPDRPNVLNPRVLHIVKFLTQDALVKILSSMDGIEELYIQGLTAKKSLFVFLGQPIKLAKKSSSTTTGLNLNPSTSTNSSNLSEFSDLLDDPTELELELEQEEAQEEDKLSLRWPLPSLKKLGVDISGYKQMTVANNVKNLRSAAKKCLKARKLVGLEIENMMLKVESDQGWIDIS